MKTFIKILIFCSFLSGKNLLAQEISTFATIEHNNNLLLTIQFKNNSQDKIILYRPTTDDFCNGIVVLNFADNNNQKLHFPCDFLSQIDHKELRCDNLIHLAKNEIMILKYSLQISDRIMQNITKFTLQLNYSDTEFMYDKSNGLLYNGILKADGNVSD